MDDSSEIAENTNAQDNSDNTTGNTSMCPATWLIVVVLLITAAAIAVAAFAVYQWRRCAQADAHADVAPNPNPYTAISQRGLDAYWGVNPQVHE